MRPAAAGGDGWFFPTTVVLAVAFFAAGLFCAWRALGSTGEQRFRFWMYCGIASCGMWAEIILILVMLFLRREGAP